MIVKKAQNNGATSRGPHRREGLQRAQESVAAWNACGRKKLRGEKKARGPSSGASPSLPPAQHVLGTATPALSLRRVGAKLRCPLGVRRPTPATRVDAPSVEGVEGASGTPPRDQNFWPNRQQRRTGTVPRLFFERQRKTYGYALLAVQEDYLEHQRAPCPGLSFSAVKRDFVHARSDQSS